MATFLLRTSAVSTASKRASPCCVAMPSCRRWTRLSAEAPPATLWIQPVFFVPYLAQHAKATCASALLERRRAFMQTVFSNNMAAAPQWMRTSPSPRRSTSVCSAGVTPRQTSPGPCRSALWAVCTLAVHQRREWSALIEPALSYDSRTPGLGCAVAVADGERENAHVRGGEYCVAMSESGMRASILGI
jgi:hypothetical protein